jgi:DNA polymerase-3 subunit gamma/tau
MELYKKHRPQNLDRVVGNEATVRALRNMIERKSVPHAILFTGPAGCGKTSLARILKQELGCDDLDYREYNSSSFRGIDTIREVQRTLNLAPAAGPCRVFLFDECHKWTSDAQAASLKMLEDTPGHVYCLLCTTNPEKLTTAIQSRCSSMPVLALTHDQLEKLILRVLKREKLKVSQGIVEDIAEAAGGSARTALVILEKVSAIEDEKEQREAVKQTIADENLALELCRALINKSPWRKVVGILKSLELDPESVRWAVLGYARSALLNPKPNPTAFTIIDCFGRPFYDTKDAGLAAACYEVVCGE